MWTEVFRFELRYQLRQPLVYLTAAALAAMGALVMTTDVGLRLVGRPTITRPDAPLAIFHLLTMFSALSLVTATAIVASGALRDFDHRTDALFFSRPLSRFDYLTGRFAGSIAVSALVMLPAVLAMAIAAWLRAPDAAPRVMPYVTGLAVVVLPNLLVTGALFFAVAVRTRRLSATLVAAVVFLGLQDAIEVLGDALPNRLVGSLIEPLGIVALEQSTRHFTAAEVRSSLPPFLGPLGANRALWLAIGGAVFWLAYRRFRFSTPNRPATKRGAATVARSPRSIQLRGGARRHPSSGSLLGHLTRFEVRTLLRDPAYWVLLGVTVTMTAAVAWAIGQDNGTPVLPVTHLMVRASEATLRWTLAIIITFYAGQLVWRDRELRIDALRDATPTSEWCQALARLAALLFLIVSFVAAAQLATAAVQSARGFDHAEPVLHVQGALLHAARFVPLAAAALFLQVVSGRRATGYLLTIALLILPPLLPRLGLEHNLYRFGERPPLSYSDMNGYGPGLTPALWFTAYWLSAAALLTVGAGLLWPRGVELDLRRRLGAMRSRSRGPILAAGAATISWVAVGAWIYFNTNIARAYEPRSQRIHRMAEYERRYRDYRHTALPRIRSVQVEMDLFPAERRVDVRGRYRVRNDTGSPIATLPMSISPHVPEGILPFYGGARLDSIELPPHRVRVRDDQLGFHVFDLETPIPPGEEIDVGFTTSASREGFGNDAHDYQLVENGVFVCSFNILPVLGYAHGNEIATPRLRAQHGLGPYLGMPDPTTPGARDRNYLDADWIDFDCVLTTAGDQTAITCGALIRSWETDGRRSFHYRTSAPITNLLAFVSARYAAARDRFDDVDLEVYYHPTHDVNVGRILEFAKRSLERFSRQYAPYPHRSLRIAEFPRSHGKLAMSLGGFIPFSEDFGFLYDSTASDMDSTAYVTAHEVAHQWWNHQLVPADAQGATFIGETLAQYSALMVMEDAFGAGEVRRYLAYELDHYLELRGRDPLGERPLTRVERTQGYLHYHKGGVAMYGLRQRFGADAIERALRDFVVAYRFAGPPYPTSDDLMTRLRDELPPEAEPYLRDMFEHITLFDSAVIDATSREAGDGRFAVHARIRSIKLHADTTGTESPVAGDHQVEIAILGDGGEITRAECLVHEGEAVIDRTVDRRPRTVVVDPRLLQIDRNRDDNSADVINVGQADTRGTGGS